MCFWFRKIIEAYDGNGDGVVESIEVAKWLCDCYRAMNKQFQPTATDIASYVQYIVVYSVWLIKIETERLPSKNYKSLLLNTLLMELNDESILSILQNILCL